MSKLCDKIEAVQTGRVKLAREGYTVQIEEQWNSVVNPSYRTVSEYKLSAKFEVRGFSGSDKREDLVHLKNMAKRQVIEEVFGEFRPLIRSIELALYNLDVAGAKTALRHLENEMMS